MGAPAAVILGCSGPALAPGEAAFFREADPFGFILFARNVTSPDDLRRLVAGLREAVGRNAPVAIDQEGGRVQRMGPPHWAARLPALDQAARVPREQLARAMWVRGRVMAAELAGVGIDVNCTPLGDIADAGTHPILRNRLYGTDPGIVAEAGAALAAGQAAGGVLGVLKHLPGHGRARLDSHLELPRVEAPLEALDAHDFAPFRALAHLPMGMTAHVVYTALDAVRPATLSPPVIAAIRERIGFSGLLMSDDLSMQALSGPLGARAAAARAAGCDVALHCNGGRAEMEAVVAAAGRLEGASLARAEAALAARRPPEPADITALEAELAALSAPSAFADGAHEVRADGV